MTLVTRTTLKTDDFGAYDDSDDFDSVKKATDTYECIVTFSLRAVLQLGCNELHKYLCKHNENGVFYN